MIGIKRFLPYGSAILLALWPTILQHLFKEYPSEFLPSILDQFAGYAAVILITRVRSLVLIVSSHLWVSWYFVGTLNTISSSIVYGQHYSNLGLSEAASIYLIACLFYVFGIIIFERLFSVKRINEACNTSGLTSLAPVGKWLLIVFPVLWIGSLIFHVGYIPVLSGLDITEDIYQTQYGPVYPYTMVLVLSALYVLQQFLSKKSGRITLLYLVVVVLVSVADGKRFAAITFMLGSIPLFVRHYGERVWPLIAKVVGVFISLYVILLFARQGGIHDRFLDDSVALFMLIGVEFRDFTYTVNLYGPGQIPGYSWLTSALAAMGNQWLLELLGFNKADLVYLGSAHAWSDLFRSEYGIRTGIVSELWFAYGVYSFPLFGLIGMLTAFLVRRISLVRSELSLVFWLGVFGLVMSSIVGQTTVTTGTFIVYVYVYIILVAEKLTVQSLPKHGSSV